MRHEGCVLAEPWRETMARALNHIRAQNMESPLFISISQEHAAVALVLSGSHSYCCYYSLRYWVRSKASTKVVQECCLNLHKDIGPVTGLSAATILAIYLGKRLYFSGFLSKNSLSTKVLSTKKTALSKKTNDKKSMYPDNKRGGIQLLSKETDHSRPFFPDGQCVVEVGPAMLPADTENDQKEQSLLKAMDEIVRKRRPRKKQGLTQEHVEAFTNDLGKLIKRYNNEMQIFKCPELSIQRVSSLKLVFKKARLTRTSLDMNNEAQKLIKFFFKNTLIKVNNGDFLTQKLLFENTLSLHL